MREPLDDVVSTIKNNHSMYYNNRNYDCSEIAEDLYRSANGKGEILEITGGNSLKVKEYGEVLDFEYHQVYSDGTYIYDPRYSNTPMLKAQYLNELEQLNNGVINIIPVQ